MKRGGGVGIPPSSNPPQKTTLRSGDFSFRRSGTGHGRIASSEPKGEMLQVVCTCITNSYGLVNVNIYFYWILVCICVYVYIQGLEYVHLLFIRTYHISYFGILWTSYGYHIMRPCMQHICYTLCIYKLMIILHIRGCE